MAATQHYGDASDAYCPFIAKLASGTLPVTGTRIIGTPERRDGLTGLAAKFRHLAARDTNVVVATVLVANILRAVSTILLTRLLTPEAFGVAGIIGVVAYVLTMISDVGFQAFVVRHPEGDKPEFRDVIWTIRLARSVVLTLLMIAVSEPLASGIGKPELAPALAASAFLFVIDGCSALSVLTALRDRLLLRLSVVETLTSVIQIAVAAALALAWRNYWAIVIAPLVGCVVKSVFSYLFFAGARRRFRIDRRYAGELWKFARFVTGSSIITMLLTQCDKIILAPLFTLDMLGYYMLASNLALAPLAFTGAYASRVLYPAYARAWLEHPEELPSLFYSGRRRMSYLYMLAVGGLIGMAPLIVAILYDDRYADAAIFLRLLAVSPLLALSSSSANEVLVATGRVHVTFHANLVKLAWLAVAVPAAFSSFGAIGLVAVVGSLEAATLLYSWWQLRRIGLLRLNEELALVSAGGFGIIGGLIVNAGLLPYT